MSKSWKEKTIKTVRVKLHNRRVTVGLCRDGHYEFKWTRLDDGKPIRTRIALSREATIATVECFYRTVRITLSVSDSVKPMVRFSSDTRPSDGRPSQRRQPGHHLGFRKARGTLRTEVGTSLRRRVFSTAGDEGRRQGLEWPL